MNIENNKRIFFSGKFGIGKTYFLREFFNSNTYKENYITFHLFPINYQILQNEDIVDFLKYDILIELRNKDDNLFKDKKDYLNLIDSSNLLYLWSKENFGEIVKTGLSFIPKLGKPFKEVVNLIESFLKFKEEVEKGENLFIQNFLSQIKEKNISEPDILSEFIKNKIKKLSNGKKTVLILDDLDRIDPEHIFRILNVFSAHFDFSGNEFENKFGFDKIILVADYQNIKNIFHHKYGYKTDFSGYINKFYSIELFQFKNEDVISKFIDKIISEYKSTNEKTDLMIQNNMKLRFFLQDILTRALNLNDSNKLNLRQLLKGKKFELNLTSDKSFLNTGIDILIKIFGGLPDNFLSTLKTINANLKTFDIITEENYRNLSSQLLKRINPFDKIGRETITWNNYTIILQNGLFEKIEKDNKEISIGFLFYDLLIEYVEKEYYKERNIFQ